MIDLDEWYNSDEYKRILVQDTRNKLIAFVRDLKIVAMHMAGATQEELKGYGITAGKYKQIVKEYHLPVIRHKRVKKLTIQKVIVRSDRMAMSIGANQSRNEKIHELYYFSKLTLKEIGAMFPNPKTKKPLGPDSVIMIAKTWERRLELIYPGRPKLTKRPHKARTEEQLKTDKILLEGLTFNLPNK